ncbi:hypothetical protein AMJ40_01855 [candidate division TA06 bacterium DG_26]|uniref:Electron transfer flavoprotein alpha/beta-subunit N-terminal domain-containing protein n=1 Tax=candidate division TA06 bacterium DG_26 TaxID=1703771 RepID=A0A0S7WKX4_UNCT6|nr:MAG: hypothetical protein AMJ40_01855 [candidate division TA06 bacterium DG_26]
MEIVVCVKRVPQTEEAEVIVDSSGADIVKDRLTYDMNESDVYALEEAVLLKEKFGGTVTLVSIGPQETDDVLRMGLAKGGDVALRLWDPCFVHSDGYVTASILARAMKEISFDLVLTGCIATDDGRSQVGGMLAGLLGIPHASYVTRVEIEERTVTAHSELEAGLIQVNRMPMPALLTIQTGINEPRYASLISIKRATSKEIRVLTMDDLGLEEATVGGMGSTTRIMKLAPPEVGKRAEILKGTPEQVSDTLTEILKKKGMI